jgi:hypothetical protein
MLARVPSINHDLPVAGVEPISQGGARPQGRSQRAQGPRAHAAQGQRIRRAGDRTVRATTRSSYRRRASGRSGRCSCRSVTGGSPSAASPSPWAGRVDAADGSPRWRRWQFRSCGRRGEGQGRRKVLRWSTRQCKRRGTYRSGPRTRDRQVPRCARNDSGRPTSQRPCVSSPLTAPQPPSPAPSTAGRILPCSPPRSTRSG